ncbi:MAG: stalk domain-containing protein [Bacillota bacterium]|nr:stalk domain-containing protein [Bacillota bacterium]
MKWFRVLTLSLIAFLCSSFATSAASINTFYSIDSSDEFENIKEVFSGNENNMYFQWARLARNNEGKIQFTTKFSFGISKFDNRAEYGIPYKTGTDIKEEYTVLAGDSLSSIASKYEMPFKILGDFNGISDYGSIRIGQKLKIPALMEDIGRKDEFKEINKEGKAYLSVFFDSADFSDKKNGEIEFLNMDETSWNDCIINPITETLDSLGFDGVVLDFEGFRDKIDNSSYSAPQKTGLKAKYNKFLTNLKNKLNQKKLAVIVQPTNVTGYFDGYDIPQITKVCDNILLMAYDFQSFERYSSNENTPSELVGKIKSVNPSVLGQPYIQPNDKVSQAVKDIVLKGAKPEKLILGINIVPVKWVKYSKKINGKNYYYYSLNRTTLQEAERAGSSEEILKGPVISKKIIGSANLPDDEKSKLNISGSEIVEVEYHYESPETIKLKYLDLTKSQKLAGIAVWRLGTGSERVWKYLFSMYEPAKVEAASKIVLKIGNPVMQVNGSDVEIDPGRGTTPIISQSRTLVPIRKIIETVGGSVEWDPDKGSTVLTYKDTKITLFISSKKIIVNGEEKEIDVAPQIINGRTYLPLRFLLENFGFKVDWDGKTQTITIDI